MDVMLFKFEGADVRAMSREDTPWFVLADVCRVLEISNPSQAATRLYDEEKSTLISNEGGNFNGLGSIGAMPIIINESGLYSLILGSRKAAARRFKKWVTGEVLPTIRKTGGYGEARAAVNLRDPAQMLQVTTQLAELLREREGEVAALRPRAEAFQRIADGSASMTITEAAKTLQIPPRQLGIALRDRGWLYRRAPGKGWLAYQSRIEAGHLEHKITELRGEVHDPALPGKFVSQVRITAKGVGQLAELLGRAPGRAAGVAAGQAGLPLAPTIAPAA